MRSPAMLSLLCLALPIGCKADGEMVVNGLRSDNPVVRHDMAEFARRFNEPRVVGGLIDALQDPSESIRIKAVESLGDLQHSAATAPLLVCLGEDNSGAVRSAAIESLGRLGDRRAIPLLVRLVEESLPDEVPLNVVWALGHIGDRKALETLSRLREEATDPHVIYNANVALRKIR